MKKIYLLFMLFSMMSMFVHAQTTRFVKPSGTSGDGTSWATALVGGAGLKAAITASVSGDKVWVAAGTYYPGTERTESFSLIDGVAIYGGFLGTETALAQRDAAKNVTILSGDIGVVGTATDNVYHVVMIPIGQNATIDGFTITGGDGTGGTGGMVQGNGINMSGASPTISNCIITGNNSYAIATSAGCGMYIYNSSPIISNCTISSNTCLTGAGMNIAGTSLPVFTNCLIKDNVASNQAGGANSNPGAGLTITASFNNCTFTNNSSLGATLAGGGYVLAGATTSITYMTFNNCLFNDNKAAGNGGGIGILTNATIGAATTLTINNCTVVNNTAGKNGGGFNAQTATTAITINLNNSIFWGNTAPTSGKQIANSLAAGIFNTKNCCFANETGDVSWGTTAVHTETACINTDPLFVNATSDYKLTAASPCVNTGNDELNTTTTDIRGAGFPRKVGTIDMGAYEFGTSTASKQINQNNDLKAFVGRNNEIQLIGAVSPQAEASLFDLQGRLITQKRLNAADRNTIQYPSIHSGIYLLTIKDGSKVRSFKLAIIE